MLKEATTPRERLERVTGKLRRCLPFWRRALIVFVVVALSTVPFAVTTPRSYKSETVVLYQETIRSAELTGGGGDGLPDGARRVGARLREALMSRANLEAVIRELHLYPKMVEQRGLVDAVEEMRKHIAFRAREGDTFEIAFEGSSAELVQDVTRRLADSIVKEATVRRSERAKTLKEFVDVESERNKTELKAREAALAGFLATHPEFKHRAGLEVLAPSTGSPTAGSAVASLEQQAARITQQLAAPPRERSAAVPAPTEAQNIPPDVLAARRDLADKLARYTDRHPDVLAARSRLIAVEGAHAAVEAEREAFKEATPLDRDGPRYVEEREMLKERLASLQRQIAAQHAAAPAVSASAAATASGSAAAASSAAPVSSAPRGSVDLEVEFRRLLREVHDARERQRQLDESQFKASITASSVMNDRNIQVSVLDPAYRPTHPSSRPRSELLAAALLLSLALALLTVGLSAWLDDRIRDRDDLAGLDVLPLLAVIPRALPARLVRKGGDG
jgi:uncharacterized protein involved in exopolysaccharide biosynthesis